VPPESGADPTDLPAPLPPAAAPPAAGLPLPLELELTSNQQEYDGQLGRYVGTGNVRLKVAGGRLLADRVEYDPETRTLYAFGGVRFQRGLQFVQASHLRYSLLEGIGEMEDVYGILDLDGSVQDLDLEAMPSAPLPPPEALSCPPDVPPPPQWHPHPWAVTGWGGQMYAANFGDTFLFKGSYRPEYLAGLGLQRRLLDAGPLAFEIDANLLGHRASSQPGGRFNQAVPFADTPAQNFGEATLGLGVRLWLQPWLSLYFVEGVSLLSEPSNYEKTFRENYNTFLNYLAFEVEALVTPQWSAVGRIHHRSGAYGTYAGVSEGSNAYLLGLRYRFGTAPPVRPPIVLPPPQGCPGAPPPDSDPPTNLARQLEIVTMGPGTLPGVRPPSAPAPAAEAPAPGEAAEAGNLWSRARAREKARREAIARIDQRVKEVTFQQSLIAERRFGSSVDFVDRATSRFGAIRPAQLADLDSPENRQLVRGTISRWRFQARRLRFTPTTFSGDRVGFTNDPFTPAQSWMDSENVVATLQPNGDTVIKAQRNRLRLEDRLPIPVTRQTTLRKKEEEVYNPWVLGVDREDRDGVYLGYKLPIRIGERGLLQLQPQIMLERAIDGSTDVYPPPGEPVDSDSEFQPASTADLFGLEARLNTPLAGFDLNARLDLSTFDPENIPDGTRASGELARTLPIAFLGDPTFRFFGAYRFRTWNGSLGEQDVQSAAGISLENEGLLPPWGRLRGNYFWRLGVGNFKAENFQSENLAELWRGNAVGALNFSLPLWIGRPAARPPVERMANTVKPVVPGLRLNANLQGTAALYGDGRKQHTLTLSAGPTLTLGHFVKSFLDYTELTLTGSVTVRQGESPLSFDRAVDLGTLGIGINQQIVGPLVFSGGIGLNVDPGSEFYGDTTNSYLELRWQRRSYEIGVFYSPYNGLGGVRVKLNDFNFRGPGVPFVPYHPPLTVLERPF
jgi:hypothetical protein